MSIRIGFVGAGGIAGMHFKNLERIPDAEVVAVMDVVKDKAQAAAEKYGAKAYTDHAKMLESEKLDAVYVCVPPGYHGAPELDAARKGLAMFVEKPVGMDLETLNKVTRAVKRKKLITAAGYQDRYQDIIDKLKKFLEGKQVGLIMGYWMGGMPGVHWWRVKKLSGGQHVEQTTHIFDMARYLFGDVKRVSAVASKGLMKDVPSYNIEDASAVNLEFKNGVIGTIFSACYLKHGNRGGIEIFGKDFHVDYVERKSITVTQGNTTTTTLVGNECAFLEDKTFIDAIRTGDASKIRSPYEDAAKSAALSILADESMRTGQFVKVK